jgi:hypothetical protein
MAGVLLCSLNSICGVQVYSLNKPFFGRYKSDFGSTDLEVLKFVARFLILKEREKLEALINEGKYKIEYQPYDWSANNTE